MFMALRYNYLIVIRNKNDVSSIVFKKRYISNINSIRLPPSFFSELDRAGGLDCV